ncbi:carboxypeptidase-like regulatory domain-containing protein [Flavobacterium sp. P21]|uniref:carboxypeptidase-like regulatory domain-containing protein n=1 Tax=Flavobacterium sp. P21 TaxID=3423948 RepID=UPI003D67A0BF
MKQKIVRMMLLFLVTGMQLIFAQERKVSGVISDASGPIPGANVMVKGTNNGAQSDFDGKYTIKAKTGDVLIFSYVGMKDNAITVGPASVINVKLQEEGKELDEVVVVAYGTAKKLHMLVQLLKLNLNSLKIDL